jgi:transcriptional regulator with XRE-family HTH domain
MPEEQRKPLPPELLLMLKDPQELKKRREQVGLTAPKLAQASGVPLSVILNIESGRTPLRRETAEWLHAAIAHDEVLALKMSSLSDKGPDAHLAKTNVYKLTVRVTWFGTIISRVGIPRRFFRQPWVLRMVSPRCTYRTWFGTILYHLGIPRRFFPQSWRCNKVKP